MASRRRLPLNVERTPGKGFRARVKVNGRVARGRTRKTPGEAADDVRELRKNVVRRGGPETLGEAFDAVLLECRRRRRRPGTIGFCEQWRKAIEAHFGEKKTGMLAGRISSVLSVYESYHSDGA